MSVLRSYFYCFLSVLMLAVCLPVSRLSAQETETDSQPIFSLGTRPFLVLSTSSPNQLKDKAAFLFESAEYPEAVEAVLQKLDENVNGLNGLDWDRPAGVAVFLNSVFPPAFEFVAFLPISTVEDFQSMMQVGTALMREDSSEPGRYELITPNRNWPIRIANDYAYIQLPPMDPDPAFDRDLPGAGTLVASTARNYAVALSLDVEAVPAPTRDLLLNLLTSFLSTQHQQRDEESDAQYAVRDAWQQRDIAGLKLLFNDTQRITIGVNVDEEQGGANIDLVLDARESSQMLEEIFLASTKPSYFTPLISDAAPLSVSYSNVMAERDSTAAAETLEALKAFIAQKIEELEMGDIPVEGSPLFNGISALRDTLKAGHLDVFAQFFRDSDEKLAVIAALRVEDGEAVAAGIQDVLQRLQNHEGIGELTIGADEHAGISFHRLEFRNPDAGALALFGNDPGLEFGSGPRTAWACVGGSASFDVLKGVIDELAAAYENPVDRDVPASFRIVLNFTEFKNLLDSAGEANRKSAAAEAESKPKDQDTPAVTEAAEAGQNRRTRQGPSQQWRQRREENRKLALETLAEGDDRIQVEARPTETGVRIRAHLEMGFVRALGKVIGMRVTQ
ncbi:MAG: hypothetical protein R3C49_24235 [Planctomycetaceae bacterium]